MGQHRPETQPKEPENPPIFQPTIKSNLQQILESIINSFSKKTKKHLRSCAELLRLL
jgi:hypothetical protein